MIGDRDRLTKLHENVGLRRGRQWPFTGVSVVLRQRMRRNSRRDLLWTILLLLGLLGLSAALESLPNHSVHALGQHTGYFWQGTAFTLYSVPSYPLRCLMLFAFGASFALMPLAGVLGAQAVPRAEESASIQEALLTRLQTRDICLGRLLVALYPPMFALGVSCLFWLLAQARMRFLPETLNGVGAIVSVHCVLLCGVWMAGSIGFVCATRLKPGAVWGRGAVVALLVAAVCLGGIVLINPAVQRMSDPTTLINAVLVMNPAAAAASALKVDVLRMQWLYVHTDAHDYPFAYPSVWISAGVFWLIGTVCVQVASWLMRRAYRI